MDPKKVHNESLEKENLNPATHHEDIGSGQQGRGKDTLIERMSDEPESLGIDLDGTNPGSNKHPMDTDN